MLEATRNRTTHGRRSTVRSEEWQSPLQTQIFKSDLQSEEDVAVITEQNQDEAERERRLIRIKYRKLINETREQRRELTELNENSLEKLKKGLDLSDRLFERVSRPNEAALDSEYQSIAAEYGFEQHKQLNCFRNERYTTTEFIFKLRTHLSTGLSEDGNEDANLDATSWEKMGRYALNNITRTTPRPHFMYLEPQPRTVIRQRKVVVEKVAPVQRPERIENREEVDEFSKETQQQVEKSLTKLSLAKKEDFFKFVVDPRSYSETIQNIFHLSFLVKDGAAQIAVDVRDNQPQLQVLQHQKPTDDDYKNGRITTNQSVLKFDYETWKKACGYVSRRVPQKRKVLDLNSVDDEDFL